MEIKDLLKEERIKLHLSLEDVARETGLDLNKITNYENKDLKPEIKDLITLLDFYKIDKNKVFKLDSPYIEEIASYEALDRLHKNSFFPQGMVLGVLGATGVYSLKFKDRGILILLGFSLSLVLVNILYFDRKINSIKSSHKK